MSSLFARVDVGTGRGVREKFGGVRGRLVSLCMIGFPLKCVR
jgi:hypothetical protein